MTLVSQRSALFSVSRSHLARSLDCLSHVFWPSACSHLTDLSYLAVFGFISSTIAIITIVVNITNSIIAISTRSPPSHPHVKIHHHIRYHIKHFSLLTPRIKTLAEKRNIRHKLHEPTNLRTDDTPRHSASASHCAYPRTQTPLISSVQYNRKLSHSSTVPLLEQPHFRVCVHYARPRTVAYPP